MSQLLLRGDADRAAPIHPHRGLRWFGSMGPWAPFAVAWRQRSLIFRLTEREIEARYRGSILGLLWSFLTPLMMLGVYTFVFSVVFQARWGISRGGKGEFALLLFSGLMLFNIFSECINRAPGLMLENVTYIKKVVFPLEVMPWVAMLGTLFNATVSLVILITFQFIVYGIPPLTAVLLPLVIAPLLLLTLGLTWFLASVGVFLRDLRQFVVVATTILLFLSPVFYPITAIPEALRTYIYANPLTLILEQSKQVLFWGHAPLWRHWGALFFGAWMIAWLGYAWFMRTRKAFADVV